MFADKRRSLQTASPVAGKLLICYNKGMAIDPSKPLPDLQESLLGLSFQFGGGGQAGLGGGGGMPKPSTDNDDTQRLLDEVMSRQEELGTNYGALNSKFGNFQTGLTELGAGYDKLNAGLGGLTSNFDTLNKQLKNIYGF